jgi:hypothetical protein
MINYEEETVWTIAGTQLTFWGNNDACGLTNGNSYITTIFIHLTAIFHAAAELLPNEHSPNKPAVTHTIRNFAFIVPKSIYVYADFVTKQIVINFYY